jgi:hypothetical protein
MQILSQDVFDILSISTREDSYTSLIGNAFLLQKEFRKNLLCILGEVDASDWDIRIRCSISVNSLENIRKDIPDLVLFSHAVNKVIIIENKIFSGEGYKQTERYASTEFKNDIANYLNFSTQPCFKFFYLTLDRSAPLSKDFIPISYFDEILSCLQNIQFSNNTIDILLNDFRNRLLEYCNWPKPQENEAVLTYFKKTGKLVDCMRTFTIVMDEVFKNIGIGELDYKIGVTANRGSGFIPLAVIYKNSWNGKDVDKYKPAYNGINGRDCYNVHFEFQWDTNGDYLTLYLHYETNPYKTQKELSQINELNGSFISEYNNKRDIFYQKFKENVEDSWIASKTVLRIAYYPFDKNITFDSLKSRINKLVDKAVPLIDEILSNS